MKNNNRHIININTSVLNAMQQLDLLAEDAVLFIVDEKNKLVGSVTDGDFRRGFIKGFDIDTSLKEFMQTNPKFLLKGHYNVDEIIYLREKKINIIPVLDDHHQIINLVNFNYQKSYLPIDALIMAGGRGERLMPLTETLPKPMLKVGDKPIIEHNIDLLQVFGIDNFWISVFYLANKIESYFGKGIERSININYIRENKPIGTAGALSLIKDFKNEHILMMNSDLLTNIDIEDFFLFYQEQKADFAVACIPYKVNIPYAVVETDNFVVTSLIEKPTYTHYSNGGLYLMRREAANMVPQDTYFNATDLMEKLIFEGKKVVSYPFNGYWLDIGRHEDYEKAQYDAKHLNWVNVH